MAQIQQYSKWHYQCIYVLKINTNNFYIGVIYLTSETERDDSYVRINAWNPVGAGYNMQGGITRCSYFREIKSILSPTPTPRQALGIPFLSRNPLGAVEQDREWLKAGKLPPSPTSLLL